MSPLRRYAPTIAAGALCVAGCVSFSTDDPAYDPGLDGLDVLSMQPALAVPGTTLVIEGRSFVDATWGRTKVVITTESGSRAFDARFVDFDTLEVDVSVDDIAALGGTGQRTGSVRVDVDSAVDHETHSTRELPLDLELRETLTPQLDSVGGGLVFVNDEIVVDGGGLLLGGGEGTTVAVVEGCFSLGGTGDCTPVGPVDVPVIPASRYDRNRGTFAFHPAIAGIRAGRFEGTVKLRNDQTTGAVTASSDAELDCDLVESVVLGMTPSAASLGQIVEFDGGGFVGGPDGSTLLHLVGEFVPERDGRPVDIDTFLVPEFVSGHTVRYALNEDDSLGDLLDMRADTGTLRGQVSPIVAYLDDELSGDAMPLELTIAPVKQVVFLNFTPQYVDALRDFGLRATDALIRERALEVVRRDYATVNVEFRTERPQDFILYAEVEIGGTDPNGLGLLGYDNTPGKDIGNIRLHDRIGGVNATTQHDGFPGYGGVFVSSMFVFSNHPGGFAPETSSGSVEFDLVFDPFRPDMIAEPITAADFAAGIEMPVDGSECPAIDRTSRIGCAVYVIGNLIGTTVSHELGHSFGLANPETDGAVHYPSDEPNRLMDAGSYRPFLERAELLGQGPSRFCSGAYEYLRVILPTSEPPDGLIRPNCF